MDFSIVVATPNLALADLLLLSLEENDTYRVHLAHDLAELQEAVDSFPVDLLIFDADFCDQLIDPLIHRILIQHPRIRCIFLSPENNPEWMPDFPNAHFVLPQPYFISTIVELAETLLVPDSEREKTISQSSTNVMLSQPVWLQDRELGGFILTSFLRESTAHAVMILIEGKVHLSQGYLSNAEVVEIASMIQREWNTVKQTDLVRFMKLQASGGKYLLYIREFQPNVLLVLVEDIRNPVSNSKVQITRLQQMLIEQTRMDPPTSEGEVQKTPENKEQETPTIPSEEASLLTDFPTNDVENLLPDSETVGIDEEQQKEKILKMLAWMPNPDPKNEAPASRQQNNQKKQKPQSELPEGKQSKPAKIEQISFSKEEPQALLPEQPLETIPEELPGSIVEQQSEQPEITSEEKPEITQEVKTEIISGEKPEFTSKEQSEMTSEEKEIEELQTEKIMPEPLLVSDSFSDEFLELLTKEGDISESFPDVVNTLPESNLSKDKENINEKIPVTEPEQAAGAFPGAIPVSQPYEGSIYYPEPATSAMADLIYTFVIIPRIPLHHLDGELEKQLSQWIPDLCIAFGWKLMRLQIRPEYTLISTQVMPGVSPASVIRILRVKTSYRIFETHSRLRSQNPSGDFWAPGYLALSGVQMPDEDLIADYMQQTRTRQGIPAAR
jgi:REP element-mobilizing transposase RayT